MIPRRQHGRRPADPAECVLKSVVDHPDDGHVDRTIDEMGVLISVNVNPEDMGKVIGKSGQTAKAIRTLLKVVGAQERRAREHEDYRAGKAGLAATRRLLPLPQRCHRC
ncbi:MAG: KH domain-containing protein [Hymenobacter sp.]